MANIFKYFGHKYLFGHSFAFIFLMRIYSDIRSQQICLYEYIRECKNLMNILIYSNIHTIFETNICSDIRPWQIFYTNIFGYLFVIFTNIFR